VDDLGTVEQPRDLVLAEPVLHVVVLEDLVEVPSALVLADHVLRDAVLLLGAGEQVLEDVEKGHGATDCILAPVPQKAASGRFAERVLEGVDDVGGEERIVIWIERRPGALWAVGRSVNAQHRSSVEPREDDYVFQGYELEDALEQANACLEDDVRVLEQDGRDGSAVKPFVRDELLKPLERWFFGERKEA
jgi:hypothetical protein